MPSDLLTLTRRFKAQLEAQDEAALKRVIDAYTLMWDRLQGRVDALLLEVEAGSITTGGVVKLERYKSLMAQIEREVARFASYLETELDLTTSQAVRLGLQHSEQLVLSIFREARLKVMLNTLPDSAIKTMLGFLQEGSPLYERIGALTGVQAQRVRDALLEGIGLGQGPRETARLIQDAFGQGLTDALRMTRTADLWSYREAARANYQENSDIVTGWIWWAELDGDTCGACMAEHGTTHSLDEELDGHYNCRCAPIPYIEGLTDKPQSGEDWFKQQDEATQKAMLGAGKYDAWSAGRFDFSQLAKQVDDDTYGTMRTETPLKELIGE